MKEPKPTHTTNGRQRGTVKWFSRSKGYGFIVTEAGQELLAHWQNIADEPEPGHQPQEFIRRPAGELWHCQQP